MKVRFQKIHDDAKLPFYAYEGDAGMDLFSCEDCVIPPGEKAVVSTGLKIQVPEGYVGLVWDKSGIATKHFIKTMAGVLDSSYRGELKAVLVNLGKEEYKIEKGDKVAQMLIQPVLHAEIEEVESVDGDTVRGEKGFGSSGK